MPGFDKDDEEQLLAPHARIPSTEKKREKGKKIRFFAYNIDWSKVKNIVKNIIKNNNSYNILFCCVFFSLNSYLEYRKNMEFFLVS